MWWKLQEKLELASNRLIKEHEEYAKWVIDENARRSRRCTETPELLSVQRPPTWQKTPGFNPYLVRARASSIAHAMTARLKGGYYVPHAPAQFQVDKAGGGKRTITTFEIADEVISNRLLRSLSRKNLSKMSSRSYAYRPGLSPHDALSYARYELKTKHRLFVAEYDFTKFFDRIDHDYLFKAMQRLDIIMTPLEESLIRSFLSIRPVEIESTGGDEIKSGAVGLAQGTSISLFLANIAATEMDRELERLGVGFVRYADDTLIWSSDYGRICSAAELLHEAAEQIGSPINVKKSEGIRLLVRNAGAKTELNKATSINYLGHSLTLRDMRIGENAVERIKQKISGFIYNNLIREPLRHQQSPSQLTVNDRDYVTCLLQIRRYIYGPLSEKEIRRYLDGTVPFMRFEGVMAFYPLVNDNAQLRALDGWLSNQVWLATRRRRNLLTEQGLPTPRPLGLSKQELVGFKTTSSTSGRDVDLRIPSFLRISKVLREATETYGFSVVPGGATLYAYD
ncbi:reverse transcriptase/maturase family protein [Mycolicibacterium aichiense]|uniref:Reverse transcriptase domain-containing protein n=1 Tax=Mycolicibacterium aichiense TaxID=1799 RepID=A0AAD1MDL9_9MYCO|nr:reverse transcriptase/maturase family protein [Mycolicibacterium aichiense]MCV7016500.1 group II intron reverse transcriptase domain-containing protein [Mycolicibacterium aichiense]BBX09723.1 hypothetical protein MAIC_45260 [Mycolicibacterium aichiense]SUA14288.1 RNA-directed DNA polymerase [Mycolicibacterium aichiense]